MGSQPSNGKKDLSLSNPIRKITWYEMALKDAQYQAKDPRRIVQECRTLKKLMELMCIIIDDKTFSFEEATN